MKKRKFKKLLKQLEGYVDVIQMEYRLESQLGNDVNMMSDPNIGGENRDFLREADEKSQIAQKLDYAQKRISYEYEMRIKYLSQENEKLKGKIIKRKKECKELKQLLNSCLYKMRIDPNLRKEDIYKALKKWNASKVRENQ